MILILIDRAKNDVYNNEIDSTQILTLPLMLMLPKLQAYYKKVEALMIK